MTTMTDTSFKPGDRVLIDHPRHAGAVWIVVQKLPKNYRVQAEGGTSTLRVDPSFLRPAPTDGEAPSKAEVIGVPYTPPLAAGELVNLRGKPGVYVVLKSTQRGYSVARLGGDQGRYWNAPAVGVTPVAEALREAILGAAK